MSNSRNFAGLGSNTSSGGAISINISIGALANSASSNTVYLQGVSNYQNTYISNVNSFAQSAYNSANNVGPQVQPAFNTANSASSNTVYLQGALNQTNSNIVTANTQLKSYTDGQISYLQGIENYQNTSTQAAYNQANTATTNASNANLLAQNAYNTANLKFSTSGGNITGPVTISSNLTVTGNLTVAGNVTTVSANNLILKDNMIYLNDGNTVANPDLGIAGNYNDGTYRHAGFFRDASDGVWKVYDQYLPEPDASPYIDTSNSSFRIASFQANTMYANVFSGSGQSLSNIPNSALSNASITINGTTIYLGSSASITAGATITDDNSTNATRYLMMGTATSGSYTVANTSSSKLTFNPGTGTLTTSSLSSGNTLPSSDNAYNLGSPSFRWANLYTADMHFSNENTEGNIIDGTTGNWTLQEGENDIYMLNNKTGKIFRIKLEEV